MGTRRPAERSDPERWQSRFLGHTSLWLAACLTVPGAPVLLRSPHFPRDLAALLPITALLALVWFMARISQDLISENELARRHSAAKSRFLARLNHEIRTPAHGMLGMAHLLSQTTMDSHQKRLLDALLQAGRTLQAIVDDVLDLAKIEAGHLTIRSAPFDLHAVCHEVIEPLRLLAQANDVTLDLAIDPAVPVWVAGDALRVRQILENLVGNAVKFTTAGSIHVSVQPAEVVDTIRIGVADTGPGIEASAHETIFDAYAQTQNQPIERWQGTGLGLAICRHLTDLMGGRIWVESQPGQGSTFFAEVRLPRADRSPPAAVPCRDHRALRILVCEDDPTSRLFLEHLLERQHHDVIAVATCQEAVHVAKTDVFDLAIFDVQTAGLDGPGATRVLREHERRSAHIRLPIIGLTADASGDTIAICREAGMDLVLTKPLQVDALAEALTHLGFAAGPGQAGSEPIPAWSIAGPLSGEPDPAFLRELLDAFLLDAPALMADLNRAWHAQDHDTVRRLAHRLAGMLSNLQAVMLVDLAKWLETHPEARENADHVKRLTEGLQDLCRSVAGRLDGLLPTDQSSGSDERST